MTFTDACRDTAGRRLMNGEFGAREMSTGDELRQLRCVADMRGGRREKKAYMPNHARET